MKTGMLAGIAGATAMLASDKLEQAISGRPSSSIPATRPSGSWVRDQNCVLAAALRAIMAEGGMRALLASSIVFVTRLATDETMQNVAGIGKPP